MRVAVAVWNNRISPVFDVAQRLLVCDLEGGRVISRREEDVSGLTPQERTARLGASGAQALICGAISRPMAAMVTATGVRLIPFVAGEVDEVLAAFSAGRLRGPAYLMPGCHRHRWGRRCGRGWWR